MSKIGNQYIIKIRDEVLATDKNEEDATYYFVEGFNALVLDNFALCQLEKLSDHDAAFTIEANQKIADAYERGVRDGKDSAAMHGSDATEADLKDSYMRGYQDGVKEATDIAARLNAKQCYECVRKV